MLSKSFFTKDELNTLKKQYDVSVKVGYWVCPFDIPAEYGDNSGTLEAVEEIIARRELLCLGKKQPRGKIEEDETHLSPRANQLIREWNALDHGVYFTSAKSGNGELNIGGVGNGGVRDQATKDAVRGLIQYVALMRQGAKTISTSTGVKITTVLCPFTGITTQFTGVKKIGGKLSEKPILTQDHWDRAWSVYGLDSEDDVKNTKWIRPAINSGKSESTPLRYVHCLLFGGDSKKRYDGRGTQFDFLPVGVTREMEESIQEKFAASLDPVAQAKTLKHLKQFSIEEPTLESVKTYLWYVYRLGIECNQKKFSPQLNQFERSFLSFLFELPESQRKQRKQFRLLFDEHFLGKSVDWGSVFTDILFHRGSQCDLLA